MPGLYLDCKEYVLWKSDYHHHLSKYNSNEGSYDTKE